VTPPTLLDDNKHASMATALMMSHHALRRDLAHFRAALERLDHARIPALREEWGNYHSALHGHHLAEDTRMFPGLLAQHAKLAPVVDKLAADHRRIDPLLDRADRAFAELPETAATLAVLAQLAELLDPHLALEEAEIVPLLRDAREFPPPTSEAEAAMYADGFAWSSHGIAEDVLERVYAMLPPIMAPLIAPARAKFQARRDQVWGPVAATQSRTPVPGR